MRYHRLRYTRGASWLAGLALLAACMPIEPIGSAQIDPTITPVHSAQVDPTAAPVPHAPTLQPVLLQPTPESGPIAPTPESGPIAPTPEPTAESGPIAPTAESAPTIEPQFVALQSELADLLGAWPGHHAVTITDLQTGQTIAVNGDQPQLAACTIKIALMIAVAQDIEAGAYTEADVADLVASAMGPSETWPARELLRIVGDGEIGAGVHRVNAVLAALGAHGSILTHPPGYPEEEYGYKASHGIDENLLTTDDLSRVLTALYRGEALSAWGTQYVLHSMTIAPDWMDQPIRASMPADARVYHKIGQLYEPGNAWNDAAIVEFERGGETRAYAIAYLGSYGASWRDAFAHETEVMQRAWAYFDAVYAP